MTRLTICIALVVACLVATAAPEPATLTVVSYNVLGHKDFADIRVAPLLELIKAQDADIICLQEVNPWFITEMREAGIFETYAAPTAGDSPIAVAGLMVLVRGEILNVSMAKLPTWQHRALLAVNARVKGIDITVATCHLESPLAAHPERKKQLEIYQKVLAAAPHAIFAGDFNFGDGEEPETATLDKTLLDAWLVLRPKEAGFTWDMERSKMAKDGAFPNETSRRLDRILFRSDRLTPQSIAIIGDKPVAGQTDVFPSDHFGLTATFRLAPAPTEAKAK